MFQNILGLGKKLPNRSKRSLLIPPMIVTENQRAPFPKIIGKVGAPQGNVMGNSSGIINVEESTSTSSAKESFHVEITAKKH